MIAQWLTNKHNANCQCIALHMGTQRMLSPSTYCYIFFSMLASGKPAVYPHRDKKVDTEINNCSNFIVLEAYNLIHAVSATMQ